MAALGDMLREAREARGISLGEAERETKIRAKYLAALEDDNLGALPGVVYARGFLNNYSQYLGLDSKEVIDYFEKQSQPTRTKIRAARGETAAPKRGGKSDVDSISINPISPKPIDTRVRYGSSYIAVSAIAVPLIVIFYFVYSVWGGNRSTNLSIPTPRPPTLTPITLPNQVLTTTGTGAFNTPTIAVALPPGSNATPTLASVASATIPPGAQVVVRLVTTRDAWMQVTVDGVVQFTGTLPNGANRTWSGKNKVRIRTGRADAVQVNVNGVDKGLMTTGSNKMVVEKEWDRSGTERIIR